MNRYRQIVSSTFPWTVVLALGGTAFLPNALHPAVVTAAGLLLGGASAMAGALTSSRAASSRTTVAVLLVLASTAWLALSSAFAENPAVSFVGVVGLHNGTALFVLGAVWLVAGILCADGRSLRRILAVVSAAGAVFTLAAVWETLQNGPQRAQGAAAGFFENSTSLGEFLAVSVACAIILALTTRDRRVRIASALASAVSLGGIALASSRTGFLGLALGCFFATLVALVPPSRGKRAGLSIGLPSFAALATAVLLGGSAGWFGTWMRDAIVQFGTERDSIWRSALAQLQRSPWVGAGLEQFSALIRWRVSPDGSFVAYGTNDPHSLPLAILLGGGILGGLLVAVGAGALVRALVARADDVGRTPAASLLAALPVVGLGAGLVGWVAPSVMLVTAVLAGAALRPLRSAAPAAEIPRVHPDRALRVAGATLAVSAIALAAVALFALGPEREYERLSERTADNRQAAETLYERWPEPGFIALSLRGVVPAALEGDGTALAVARRLSDESKRDARWSVDLAVTDVVLSEPAGQGESALFADFVAKTRTASAADPASGLWSSLEAVEAERLGLRAKAQVFAREALRHPMDVETRSLLETIASQ